MRLHQKPACPIAIDHSELPQEHVNLLPEGKEHTVREERERAYKKHKLTENIREISFFAKLILRGPLT